MNPDTAVNVAKSFKMLSVWVAGAICALVGYYLNLSIEEQQAWLRQYPTLKTYAPQIAFLVWYAARVKSQGGIELPWETVPTSTTAVVPIPGNAVVASSEPDAPTPGRYTPEDIEILLKADQLLKAGRSVGAGAR